MGRRGGSWLGRVYTAAILAGLGVAAVLLVLALASRLARADHSLAQLSPYTGLADLVASAAKMRLPKPILLAAVRDMVALLARLPAQLEEPAPGPGPARSSPTSPPRPGASLLYVSSFCGSLFGREAGLSDCRARLQTACQLDILAWFDTGPAEDPALQDRLERCLATELNAAPGFLASFHQEVGRQEAARLATSTQHHIQSAWPATRYSAVELSRGFTPVKDQVHDHMYYIGGGWSGRD